jgi:tetratricopeptide (TPR) repeat protein
MEATNTPQRHVTTSEARVSLFESDINIGHNMLYLLVQDTGNCSLGKLFNKAETHFQEMMKTYPVEYPTLTGSSSSSHDSGIAEIHHMILQEYLYAVNSMRERFILAQADQIASIGKTSGTDNLKNVRNNNGLDLCAVVDEQEHLNRMNEALTLYENIINSMHPLIRYSARYNKSVCQYNLGRHDDALRSFQDLDHHISLQLSNDKDVHSNSWQFHEHVLHTVRATVTLISKLIADQGDKSTLTKVTVIHHQ